MKKFIFPILLLGACGIESDPGGSEADSQSNTSSSCSYTLSASAFASTSDHKKFAQYTAPGGNKQTVRGLPWSDTLKYQDGESILLGGGCATHGLEQCSITVSIAKDGVTLTSSTASKDTCIDDDDRCYGASTTVKHIADCSE